MRLTWIKDETYMDLHVLKLRLTWIKDETLWMKDETYMDQR